METPQLPGWITASIVFKKTTDDPIRYKAISGLLQDLDLNTRIRASFFIPVGMSPNFAVGIVPAHGVVRESINGEVKRSIEDRLDPATREAIEVGPYLGQPLAPLGGLELAEVQIPSESSHSRAAMRLAEEYFPQGIKGTLFFSLCSVFCLYEQAGFPGDLVRQSVAANIKRATKMLKVSTEGPEWKAAEESFRTGMRPLRPAFDVDGRLDWESLGSMVPEPFFQALESYASGIAKLKHSPLNQKMRDLGIPAEDWIPAYNLRCIHPLFLRFRIDNHIEAMAFSWWQDEINARSRG
jgi:hypothetical protein